MVTNRTVRGVALILFLGALLLESGCAGTAGNSGGGGQSTAPAAPTGLTAAPGNAQVLLTWATSASATGYNVKRSTTTGGPYTQIASLPTASFTDTPLTNGTKYYYVASASNSAGESPNSAEVSATPTLAPPAVPAGLVATAGNAQVTLTWNASTGATSYQVKRSTVSGAETQIAAPNSHTFTDTGVTNGTKYFYVVSAVNSTAESANSNEVSATPAAPPTAPAAPTGLQGVGGNAKVTLTWNASAGATTYHVKRSTTSGAETQIAAPASNTFADTTVTNGTKYFYEVSAVNATGESANSNEVSATPTAPATAPPTPTGLQAIGGNSQISLTWNASTGATSYNVKRSTTTGGPFNTTLASPTATNYLDTTVTNGTAYFYVVSAVNSTGESANSSQVTATPVAATADITVTIDPTKTKSISPYIYGINFYSGVTGAPPQLTFDRAGGNRWTAYNWETNASNAGSDFLYENDDFLTSSTVPAEAVRTFIAGDQSNGLASLMTVQLQGLVSADESGPVSVTSPPDLSRFKTVVDQKSTVSSAPFTITPPTTDANVYMDEFVWALDQKFSGQGIFGANPAHPTFVSLDNEPELWNSTHLEIQGPNPVTSDAYIAKTITMTEALKTQFPNMIIFGPVHYGFQGIYNWQVS
jgi:fibronectin type 3 domain-containing protein